MWAQALAGDVVMYSPILTRPFRGREDAIELFGVLFDELGEMQITDELSDGDTHAFSGASGLQPRASRASISCATTSVARSPRSGS